MKNRKQELRKNFKRLFWAHALMNVKLLNMVMALFYVSRGLTLSQILFLGIIWSSANLLFEIPSSYMADRWGRKKTLLFGLTMWLGYWVVLLFGEGFAVLALASAFYGISYAAMSGTDQALIYDTEKELSGEGKTLSRLGKYQAGQNIFKIISPIIAVFIAKDLLDWQFQLVIVLDIIATLFAFWFIAKLVEPNHRMDLEEMEAGTMKDAFKIAVRTPGILMAILNREFIFLSSVMVWKYFQEFYVSLGVPLIILGVAWGFRHGLTYVWRAYIVQRYKDRVSSIIHICNWLFTFVAMIFLTVYFTVSNPYILFFLYLCMTCLESARMPLFSEYFNKKFKSFNRATTLSLVNFFHNLLEIPLFLIGGILIAKHVVAPYGIAFVLGLVTLLFFRLKPLVKKSF